MRLPRGFSSTFTSAKMGLGFVKILFLGCTLCFYTCYSQQSELRNNLIANARRYEGIIEKTNKNDGPAFDYMRELSYASNAFYRGSQMPTCGFFVNMVFVETGFDITCVKSKGVAYAYLKCPDKILLGRSTTADKVEKLKLGMTVVYKFSHVGIITGVYPTYLTTIESNTSTIGALNRYAVLRGGIYEKIRKYNDIMAATDCVKCLQPIDNKRVLNLKKKHKIK